MWFNLAAAQGDEKAKQGQDRTARQMTPDQIAVAQRLSSECYASNYRNCDAPGRTTATNNPGRPGTMIIRGVCSKLVAGGKEYSSHCTGEVASVTNADGTISFIFSADGTMVAFSGNGREVKPAEGGIAILPVSFVAVRLADQTPEMVPASGQCRFTDPYRPKPALVDCSASTARGSAEGLFRSDGMPPRTP